MGKGLTKEELVRLVENLMSGEGTEEESDAWLALLRANVPDPEVSDIIFWPNMRGLPDDLTAEQIVELALSYKPILLGPARTGKKVQADANRPSHETT